MKTFLTFLVGATALAGTAAQAITVDGTINVGEYAGAFTTVVPYTPGASTDFSTINDGSENTAYTVYYTADATNIYVALQTNPAGAGLDGHDASLGVAFANLYFDLDQVPGDGSDVGFEVFNDRAFEPVDSGPTPFSGSITALGAQFARTVGTTYANGGLASSIEFSAPISFFTTNVLGLNLPLVQPGGSIDLRTSQAFGYSPVSGDAPGQTAIPRFGSIPVNVAAVPEPATWGMMLLGFGLVGAAARRRRVVTVAA